MEFPIAFLSHTFTETQQKWSTTEQEAYGIYYAITKWNYYLQGTDIIVRNDHKPPVQFLNGKNTNNKVNRWSLELATYNISLEWISGARNKAVDCLLRLVTPTTTSVNMLTVPPLMDQLSIPEVIPKTPFLGPPQLYMQIQHLRCLRNPLLPQNCSQRIAWKPYYKCRRLTHSVNTFPDYSMTKHLTMNLTLLLTSKDSYTNISWMLVKSFSLWSFLNLGNIQYSWKLMTNWVTKVIHTYIVLSNANTIGKG